MSKILLKTVNKHVVNAIPLKKVETRKARGWEICPEPYANIFCVAKKKSGKTSSIYHMLEHFINGDTRIIAFCATIDKDKNWEAIRDMLEENGNPTEYYTSIKDENGNDRLRDIVRELQEQAQEEYENQNKDTQEDQKARTDLIFNYLKKFGYNVNQEDEEEEKPKKKKDKYVTPEIIIIFDDLGEELKTPSLLSLLCKNRHFKCKIIISSQYLNHLLPESRKQLDLFLMFKGLPPEKIKEIHRDADINMPLEMFDGLYQKATDKKKFKYPFFYVDTRNDIYRRNFNDEFKLPEYD